MSSSIYYKDQYLWVSNQRFANLVDFAVEVGNRLAKAPEEAASVKELQQDRDNGSLFPGCDLNLNSRFAARGAKEFWFRVFHEVAMGIFLRQLGNHDVSSWQPSAICDAEIVARMLSTALRDEDEILKRSL